MPKSTADAAASGAPAPKRKAPGPFRTGAIIPFLGVAALTWAYFHFFFDGHLRRGLEYAATGAVGAQVDVAAVETRFWDASAVIEGIQVTDASAPSRNLVQIGSVRFRALWDGLLRGKLVIDHAEVVDIELLAPRAAPGKVLPAEPQAEGGMTDTLLAGIKREFEGNVLADVAAMAGGADAGDTLGKLGDTLKSSARIAALQEELAQKEKAWNERLASLPKTEEIAALEQRLQKVKLDGFKDLNQVSASAKELGSIRDAANGYLKNVQGTGRSVTSDASAFRAAYGEIDQAVKRDVADLQAHFRLPALDAENMSNVLFGPELFDKVSSARNYMDKARKYLPPKRTPEEKAALKLQPPPRGTGRDYAFGRPSSYPLFWLKRAGISSRSGKGPYAGDLKGTLTDVTTEPVLVGRPLVLRVEGDFPGRAIYDTRLELMVDHTTEQPVEKLDLQIGRFPVTGRTLVQSEAVSLGFAQAGGSARFGAELRGDAVDVNLVNDFTGVDYQVKAKSPTVQAIVSGAVDGVSAVNLTARVSGTWSKLEWRLATNLGAALEQGFRKQFQAQLDKARSRIEAMVNERTAGERKKLQERYAAVEASLKEQLAGREKALEGLRARLDKAKAKLQPRGIKW